MKLFKWMLATVLVLDAALVMTSRVVPTTSPVQSVGMAADQESNMAVSTASLALDTASPR